MTTAGRTETTLANAGELQERRNAIFPQLTDAEQDREVEALAAAF